MHWVCQILQFPIITDYHAIFMAITLRPKYPDIENDVVLITRKINFVSFKILESAS